MRRGRVLPPGSHRSPRRRERRDHIRLLRSGRAFFAAHGITRFIRVVTDNGANYWAKDFHRTVTAHASWHQRTRPYTPRHSGNVERYQRILAEECLCARVYDREPARRTAIGVCVNHYNYYRPHTACSDHSSATKVRARVNNVIPSDT
ncbi:hypothetical protein EAE32_10415 [Kocuria tytonicola]|uniref:Integrase catalytic domain-containing protein n=1 Tax=Kocuria tytonicola TaxID=2055946 RepID=A0A3L9KZ04_9MICC|nr:hypothetical protein EAE32_10415 [Kocuria tytonicola]